MRASFRLLGTLACVALTAGVAASCATSATTPSCDDAGAATSLCGALCVDVQTDPENCGACGKACAATEACVAGKCSAQCPAGELLCGGDAGRSCVNAKTDNKNCGACGKTCKSTEACIAGGCSSSCPIGKTMCTPEGGAAYCTDTKNDNANCGACGRPCNATEACVGGVCQGSCAPEQTLCGADAGKPYCANLDSDNANCGDCGKACGAFQTCTTGACLATCSPLQKLCTPDGGPAYCADTLSDNVNCGTCGTVCPANKPVCFGGQCTDGSKINVLVCAASTAQWVTEVQQKLQGTGSFTLVDVVACGSTTPTLQQMLNYQSMLVFSDSGFSNATTLGNNLADYVDQGGYAVVATFANASVLLAGRWISGGYNLIQGSGQEQPAESQPLQILDAMSPLVVGVKTLTATSAYRSTGGAANGGVVVANWGSGKPLIVRGVKNGKNRAELNFYPPSITSRADFWSGDGAVIMRNALIYR